MDPGWRRLPTVRREGRAPVRPRHSIGHEGGTTPENLQILCGPAIAATARASPLADPGGDDGAASMMLRRQASVRRVFEPPAGTKRGRTARPVLPAGRCKVMQHPHRLSRSFGRHSQLLAAIRRNDPTRSQGPGSDCAFPFDRPARCGSAVNENCYPFVSRSESLSQLSLSRTPASGGTNSEGAVCDRQTPRNRELRRALRHDSHG